MPRAILTPTQKATLTGTFFIKAQFWTPSGSRIELEIPWVPEKAGDDLLRRMTMICGAKMEKTREEWEEIAMKALDAKRAMREAKRKRP